MDESRETKERIKKLYGTCIGKFSVVNDGKQYRLQVPSIISELYLAGRDVKDLHCSWYVKKAKEGVKVFAFVGVRNYGSRLRKTQKSKKEN